MLSVLAVSSVTTECLLGVSCVLCVKLVRLLMLSTRWLLVILLPIRLRRLILSVVPTVTKWPTCVNWDRLRALLIGVKCVSLGIWWHRGVAFSVML